MFSWKSPGVRNITATGNRVFTIDSRNLDTVNFNQESGGDYGDWQSQVCPQLYPFVQNAFACPSQASDVTVASFEAQCLDVIGYDLDAGAYLLKSDFNGDGREDLALYNESTGQTAVWYLYKNYVMGGELGPTIADGWKLVAVADFNRDAHPDYLLVNTSTGQTAIWYLNRLTLWGAAYGPTIPPGWQLLGVADVNNDGYPDYLLYNLSTFRLVWWYLNNNVQIGQAASITLTSGSLLGGIADMKHDNYLDYVIAQPNGQGYLTSFYDRIGDGFPTPTIPEGGFQLVGVADFNYDGHPDFLLFNPNTQETVIWYLDDYGRDLIGGALGPSLPPGWNLVAPK